MDQKMEKDYFSAMGSLQGAFAQCLFVVAGLAALVAGVWLLYNRVRWMLKAVEVEGEVTGVRRYDNLFYATYRYSFADGETQHAMADAGTADTHDLETGKKIKLLALRDAPETVHVPGNPLWAILGGVLAAMGLGLLAYAFTAFEVTGITWATAIAFILYSLNKYKRHFGTRREREAIRLWQDKQWEELKMTAPTTLEQIRSNPAEQLRQDKLRTQRGIMGALCAFAGVAAIVLGVVLAGEKLFLYLDGTAATGTVTEIEGSYTKGKNSRFLYHPVVRFTDKQNKEWSFREKEGSDPAEFGEGDDVKIVYNEKEPQQSALIDRGLKVWFMPGVLAVAGLFFLLLGMGMMPRQRDEAR